MKKSFTVSLTCLAFLAATSLSLTSCNSTKSENSATTVETLPSGADPDPTISDRVIEQANDTLNTPDQADSPTRNP